MRTAKSLWKGLALAEFAMSIPGACTPTQAPWLQTSLSCCDSGLAGQAVGCSRSALTGVESPRFSGRSGLVRLVQEFLRNFAAIFGKFSQHFLVQPHIHGGRIVGVAGVMQFSRELFARSETAVHADEFHQIND